MSTSSSSNPSSLPSTFPPERLRPRLTPPARVVARAALHAVGSAALRTAGHVAWRLRHPDAREGYLEAPEPDRSESIWFDADDGWRAPLAMLAPRPGGAGEPVLLAHATGVGRDGFRYGRSATLAGALAARGYAVYLLSHRGDRFAVAPSSAGARAAMACDFDAILDRDVPAALERIRRHSGFPRVHWVGHGLGGQLGLAWAGRGGEGLAAVAALAAPISFDRPRSESRRLAVASHLVPAGVSLPVRWLARVAAPLLGADDLGGALSTGASPGARVRGAACWASEDVALGLAGQIAGWVGGGAWTTRAGVVDYAETLRSAAVPLLVLVGSEDRICPPQAALRAAELWGGPDRTAARIPGYGHLDALLGSDAAERVFEPLADWLEERRRLAWEDGFESAARVSAAAVARCSTRSARGG